MVTSTASTCLKVTGAQAHVPVYAPTARSVLPSESAPTPSV
jgi:hypothetical protein